MARRKKEPIKEIRPVIVRNAASIYERSLTKFSDTVCQFTVENGNQITFDILYVSPDPDPTPRIERSITRFKEVVCEFVVIDGTEVHAYELEPVYQEIGGGPIPPTPVLPDEYQQVEWIASNGDQYILTGKYLTNGSVGIKYKSMATATQSYGGEVVSVRTGYTGGALRLYCAYGSAAKYYSIGTGNGTGNVSISSEEMDTILNLECEFEGTLDVGNSNDSNITGKWIIDGITTTKTGTGKSFDNTAAQVAVFGNKAAAGGTTFKGRIYYVNIVNDDVDFLNLIPCYEKESGTIGMWDTISETFMTNSGSGTFTKGPDVE